MASEVSLVGQIPAEVHQALCDRLSHLSQHGYPFTTHEVVYDGREPSASFSPQRTLTPWQATAAEK